MVCGEGLRPFGRRGVGRRHGGGGEVGLDRCSAECRGARGCVGWNDSGMGCV